ncbi:hypothetical protein II906_05420 [bacterium]|nr:hypothetical protein [bacterium]
MKKILAYGLLTIFILGCTANAKSYFAPEWSEFCPDQYLTIDTTKNYKLAVKKYWQRRKIEFDKKVETCNKYEENERENCYEEIRRIEGNMTQTYLKVKELYTLEQLNSSCRNCHH